MKLGFIGLGNMATAMIQGMIAKGIMDKGEIVGSSKSNDTASMVQKKLGIDTYTDNQKVAKISDVLFLAIKPQFMEEVLREIKPALSKETIIVSIAAGKTMEWIEKNIGGNHKIFRCMPNTPAQVGEGCTAVCGNKQVNDDEREMVLRLLQAFGQASFVEEKQMDAVVAVSGSSPAYVFMFIEAMADGAVKAGMPRKQAYEFAAQAVLGSAKMVLETAKHPGTLKDMVCSPGGTTIEAVKVLEEKGFRGIIMDAMEACIRRNREL